MTNKQAFYATLQLQYSVPSDTVDLALINADIDGDATYTKVDQEGIEKATIPVLYGLFTAPDIREGDFSVSHPDFLRKVKERLVFFATKYAMTDMLNAINPKPTVRGVTPW